MGTGIGVAYTSMGRLRILYHIVNQDTECYNNPSRTGQVPGSDYAHALPHCDIR